MATKILIVEDESDIAELIRYNVERAGYQAQVLRDGHQALQSLRREVPDLLVLDLMLPGMDGLELCRRLRAEPATRALPIIMVTAKGEETDRVVGLEMGADDYLVKPFSPRELVARLRAVLRRRAEPAPEVERIVAGDLTLDQMRHEVARKGVAIPLSAMEFKLLAFLLANRGRAFTREQLLDRVWGQDRFVEPRTVDVHIRRLREKVEADPKRPSLILTVRGLGYRCAD
jgi:phosphate regulon transcriptional regulator PhoB